MSSRQSAARLVVRADEDGPNQKLCKFCEGVWVRHHTGCPILRAWKLLNLTTILHCLRCELKEEQPHWGYDEAKGLCKLCSLDADSDLRLT
jgi:hypothetical protein